LYLLNKTKPQFKTKQQMQSAYRPHKKDLMYFLTKSTVCQLLHCYWWNQQICTLFWKPHCKDLQWPFLLFLRTIKVLVIWHCTVVDILAQLWFKYAQLAILPSTKTYAACAITRSYLGIFKYFQGPLLKFSGLEK